MKSFNPQSSNASMNAFGGSVIMDNYSITPEDSPTGKAIGGIPYHGKGLNLKNTDSPAKMPRKRKIAYCKKFNMEDPNQAMEYTAVMQKCADGIAMSSVKEVLKHESPLQIYLEWYEIICIDPSEK